MSSTAASNNPHDAEKRLVIGFLNWAHAIDHFVLGIYPTVVIGLEVVFASFLVGIMMAAAIGQTATEMDSPQINRIAAKLKCNCGCNQNMACVMPPG